MTIVEQPAVSAVKTCGIDSCDKPRRKRGWCEKHYERWRSHGDPLWAPPQPQALCSIEGCEEPHYARGLCKKHYERWRQHGDPLVRLKPGAPPAPPQLCSIEGCEEPREARGWCAMHYTRWKRNGDPIATRYPAAVPAYGTVHRRLSDELHPSTLSCDHCGGQAEEWAYDHADPAELTSPQGRPYSADPRHYIPLCKSCHRRFDRVFRQAP